MLFRLLFLISFFIIGYHVGFRVHEREVGSSNLIDEVNKLAKENHVLEERNHNLCCEIYDLRSRYRDYKDIKEVVEYE